MKALILIIAATIISGCATTYTVERTDPETGATTSLTVKSYREFPGGIDVSYNRETGSFDLQAGEVSNDKQMASLIAAILPLIPVPAQ